MAVIKKKDVDWRYYLRELAESTHKISEIEQIEFSGYLLRRDMEHAENRKEIFANIMLTDNCLLADLIASCLIAECPETLEDLTRTIKNIITDYYRDEVSKLITNEEINIKIEKEDHPQERDPDELY